MYFNCPGDGVITEAVLVVGDGMLTKAVLVVGDCCVSTQIAPMLPITTNPTAVLINPSKERRETRWRDISWPSSMCSLGLRICCDGIGGVAMLFFAGVAGVGVGGGGTASVGVCMPEGANVA